jgi:hypothetical protein
VLDVSVGSDVQSFERGAEALAHESGETERSRRRARQVDSAQNALKMGQMRATGRGPSGRVHEIFRVSGRE